MRTLIIWTQRKILGLSRHWLAWANLVWGLIVGLPWLAPVLMKIGATGPARAIYHVYSFLCHQLANRSFFLFGSNRNLLPQRFYVGTEVGSFNSWMRLITGLLFGLAMAWMVYPVFEAYFRDIRQTLEACGSRVKEHVAEEPSGCCGH
jgi:uncharacterized membrane protein